MATPLEISIALWYYCRVGDYGDGSGDNNHTAPAVQTTFQQFVDAGLLKRHEPNADLPQRYYATDGMRVYVEALCAVPWPEQKWIIPAGRAEVPDMPTPTIRLGDQMLRTLARDAI